MATPSESKPTINPKDLIGTNKIPYHLWPATASALGSLAMLEGALKYGRSNFREMGVQASVYVSACERHLKAWFEGEDAAPDSELPHLAHALACLAILVEAQAQGNLKDDRQYRGNPQYRNWIDQLEPHVKRLRDKYADKDPKHYTIQDNDDYLGDWT